MVTSFLEIEDKSKMNKNVKKNMKGLCLVIFVGALIIIGNNASAVQPASVSGNLELMDQAISHSEEALKHAKEGHVDQTTEHIEMALASTDEIEVANAAAKQRAVYRLKDARRILKKGKPIEETVGLLEDAVKFLEELKAKSL